MLGKVKRTMPNKDFLETYLHAAGRTQVPRVYHIWSCLSLLAAALANRVWYEKFRGKQLKPNLYVMLIGPSGLGKGEAIDFAMEFVSAEHHKRSINPYRGKVTGAAFADALAKPRKDENGDVNFDPDETPVVYLFTPELSMSLGEGKIADDFVKRMTELYTGGNYEYTEATRTHGEITFRVPTINWLAGSTREWLHESVSRSAIKSGFFGRAVPIVVPTYDLVNRITDPGYPNDRDSAVAWLHKRIRAITQLEGRCVLTNQAKEVRDAWYQNRPAPIDDDLLPSWVREDDLALKIGMLLSVSSGRDDLVITSRMFQQAITLAQQAHSAVPELISSASQTLQTTGLTTVATFVKSARRIPHSALLKKVTHRGIHAKELQQHVDTLKQQKMVSVERTQSGGAVYVWSVGTREVFTEVDHVPIATT
jgi:hypothetical protein